MQSAKVIAKKLVEKFKELSIPESNYFVLLDEKQAKGCATLCAKEMQKMFKAGWDSFGPDHSVTDTEEYWILRGVPKEIKKL